MNLGNTNGPTTQGALEIQRGIGLGFCEGIVSVATNSDFRGFLLGTNGRLILTRAGANNSPRADFPAEVATGLNTTIDHNLSCDIDTKIWEFSNILRDGLLQADVDTTIVDSNVNRVGFFARSQSGGTRSRFDDFTVTDVAATDPSADPLITSITRVDNTTYELRIIASADTEFAVSAPETLDFKNGVIVDGLTRGNIDDPGQVSSAGDSISTDESGNATFRMISAAAGSFVRIQPPVTVGL